MSSSRRSRGGADQRQQQQSQQQQRASNNSKNSAAALALSLASTGGSGGPRSHPMEQNEEHRAFLIRSLERNDVELAALVELNRSLTAVRNAILHTLPGGETILLDLGMGKIRLDPSSTEDRLIIMPTTLAATTTTPATPSSVSAAAAGAGVASPSNPSSPPVSAGKKISTAVLSAAGQDMCIDFLLRMKLRRRLLNRLSRRLLRIAHAMDGNDVAPPALLLHQTNASGTNKKYGDLRLHVDPNAVESFVQQWKRQEEALRAIQKAREQGTGYHYTKPKDNKNASQDEDDDDKDEKEVNDEGEEQGDNTRKSVKQNEKEEEKGEDEMQVDDDEKSESETKKVVDKDETPPVKEEQETNPAPDTAASSPTKDATRPTTPTTPDQDHSSSMLAVQEEDPMARHYEALRDFKDAYEKEIDPVTGKLLRYTILDEDEQQQQQNQTGLVHNKGQEEEHIRWRTALLARIPEQPTFEELGMQHRVFFVNERRKRARQAAAAAAAAAVETTSPVKTEHDAHATTTTPSTDGKKLKTKELSLQSKKEDSDDEDDDDDEDNEKEAKKARLGDPDKMKVDSDDDDDDDDDVDDDDKVKDEEEMEEEDDEKEDDEEDEKEKGEGDNDEEDEDDEKEEEESKKEKITDGAEDSKLESDKPLKTKAENEEKKIEKPKAPHDETSNKKVEDPQKEKAKDQEDDDNEDEDSKSDKGTDGSDVDAMEVDKDSDGKSKAEKEDDSDNDDSDDDDDAKKDNKALAKETKKDSTDVDDDEDDEDETKGDKEDDDENEEDDEDDEEEKDKQGDDEDEDDDANEGDKKKEDVDGDKSTQDAGITAAEDAEEPEDENQHIHGAPPPQRSLSLIPTPSFYVQDLKRIRSVHYELLTRSMQDHAKRRLAEVTKEYNRALENSNALYEKRQILHGQLSTLPYEQSKLFTLKSEYEVQVAVARSRYNQELQHFNKEKLNHLLPSRRGQNPTGTQMIQHYARHPDRIAQNVAACLADVVDAVDAIAAGAVRKERFRDFVPPPLPPGLDHQTLNETPVQRFNRMETHIRQEINNYTAKLRASEEERQKCWKKMTKTKAEFDIPHTTTTTHGNDLREYSMSLPTLRSGAAQSVSHPTIDTAASSLPTYVPAVRPRTTTTSTGMASSSAAAAANTTNSPGGAHSLSKYSAARVRERISADGTVAPVNEPKKTKDGLFQRPAGRTRKGMEWDAVRGIWVPTGTAPIM